MTVTQITQQPMKPTRRHLRSQTVGQVVSAEVFRLRRAGGMLGGLVVAVSVGIAAGSVALIVLLLMAQDVAPVLMTTPLELSATAAMMVVSLVTASASARDASGQTAVALALVPRRGRYWLGRSIAGVLLSVVSVLAACGPVLAACAVFGTGGRYLGAGFAVVLCAALASAFLGIFATGAGALTRSPALAILVLLGALVLVPVAASIVAELLPRLIGAVISGVSSAMPGNLAMDAVAISTIPARGVERILIGQLGLMAWAAAAAAVSWRIFGRRDAPAS
ncbi:hypothetical protein [Microbacterium sp.]|uniref:hypothetical protein n=1 Tax=Microbacterium sp. TaxID=51671 RepID=UPI00333FBDB7